MRRGEDGWDLGESMNGTLRSQVEFSLYNIYAKVNNVIHLQGQHSKSQ